jgi:hypothetical protein
MQSPILVPHPSIRNTLGVSTLKVEAAHSIVQGIMSRKKDISVFTAGNSRFLVYTGLHDTSIRQWDEDDGGACVTIECVRV